MDNTTTTPTSVPTFTLKEINVAVAAMVKAQDRSATAIGKVLVMAVFASIVGIEGDHTAVADMVTRNLRKSVKGAAAIAFMEKFGQLYYAGRKEGWQHFALGTQKDLAWTAEYVKAVQDAALTWESLKVDAPELDFDVEAKIRKIIADAAKRQKAGKSVMHAELLADLPGVLAKHTALLSISGN